MAIWLVSNGQNRCLLSCPPIFSLQRNILAADILWGLVIIASANHTPAPKGYISLEYWWAGDNLQGGFTHPYLIWENYFLFLYY